MAEEYVIRLRRAEIGIHHHIAGAHLLRYAQEPSWRENNRRTALALRHASGFSKFELRSVLRGDKVMRRQRHQPLRNKLDLNDRKQVRVLKKKLRVSEPELAEIVGRIGNSISAISKEVTLQRASQPPQLADIAPVSIPSELDTLGEAPL